MSDRPETRFAAGPDGVVAYQVWGRGSLDLLFVSPWAWNIEMMWDEPRIERFLRRLGTFARVVAFDKRGTGVSDPIPLGALPTLEQWADDIRVVLAATATDRAAVLASMEGVQMALVYAATHPERVHSVVAMDGAACYLRHDDYPIGVPERLVDYSTELMFGAGDGHLTYVAPTLDEDPQFRRWWRHFSMLSVSPTSRKAMYRHGMHWDIRAALPMVSTPTLVMHRSRNRYLRAEYGRYLADNISGARYVEMEGSDALFFAGDQDVILGEIEAFLTGVRGAVEADRVLATVLFTDIVASTDHAARLGDARWRETLDRHDRIVADSVAQFRGTLIKTTGDGVLASFDGPARATRCASAMVETVRSLGMEIRAGVHAGEVELRRADIGGIAVNIAARVVQLAAPGEVLVSRTVRDLVVGSGIEFRERGEHELKGVPGSWQLFAAT